MKYGVLAIPLALAACSSRESGQGETAASAKAGNILAKASPAARSDGVVPRPSDPAQLDRMIAAGYTPHGNHMHPPGVNECPLTKGNDAVM